MNAVARLLSIVLHPLFMPTYTLWLTMQLDPHMGFFLDARGRWLVLGMVALMTIAFPITSTLLFIRAGIVSGLNMPSRRERIAPFTMTLLYYGMAWFLLARTPLHSSFELLFFGAFIALALTTLVTIRWKISAHMVGIGGCIGALIGVNMLHGLDLFLPIVGTIVLAGALGTARLLTSDHTPAQVYAGLGLGLLCSGFGVLAPWRYWFF